MRCVGRRSLGWRGPLRQLWSLERSPPDARWHRTWHRNSYHFSIDNGVYNLGHKEDQAAGVLDLSTGTRHSALLEASDTNKQHDALTISCTVCLTGSVPVLYVDGKAAIAQSRSIERYLAKQFGLAGSTDVQTAQVDMWTEHVRDVQDKYQKAKSTKDAECEDPVAKWMKDDLPGLLAKLDKVAALTSTTPGCAVGDDLTLADIKIWMFAGAFRKHQPGVLIPRLALTPCLARLSLQLTTSMPRMW